MEADPLLAAVLDQAEVAGMRPQMIQPFAPRSKRPAAATEGSGSSTARSSTDPAPAVDPPLPPPSHPPPSAPAKSNTLPPTSKVKAPPGDTPSVSAMEKIP